MRHPAILIYALLGGACFSLPAADDPGGWSKAKWGMSEPQLADAFGPGIVRLDPPDKVSGIPVLLAVDLDLAGSPFRAKLILDKYGKLSSVLLQPRQTDACGAYLFQSLQNSLVEKYGRPWKSEAGMSTDLQWSLATTVIHLSLAQEKQLGFCLLTLQYKHKPVDDTL